MSEEMEMCLWEKERLEEILVHIYCSWNFYCFDDIYAFLVSPN